MILWLLEYGKGGGNVRVECCFQQKSDCTPPPPELGGVNQSVVFILWFTIWKVYDGLRQLRCWIQWAGSDKLDWCRWTLKERLNPLEQATECDSRTLSDQQRADKLRATKETIFDEDKLILDGIVRKLLFFFYSIIFLLLRKILYLLRALDEETMTYLKQFVWVIFSYDWFDLEWACFRWF